MGLEGILKKEKLKGVGKKVKESLKELAKSKAFHFSLLAEAVDISVTGYHFHLYPKHISWEGNPLYVKNITEHGVIGGSIRNYLTVGIPMTIGIFFLGKLVNRHSRKGKKLVEVAIAKKVRAENLFLYFKGFTHLCVGAYSHLSFLLRENPKFQEVMRALYPYGLLGPFTLFFSYAIPAIPFIFPPAYLYWQAKKCLEEELEVRQEESKGPQSS